MKKVICVDAKDEGMLTEGQLYDVVSEKDGHYMLQTGVAVWAFAKSRFRDSEPAFQYGQEVEFKDKPTQYGKLMFLYSHGKYAWVKSEKGMPFTVDTDDIRPVRSVKEQIVEVLQPKLAFNNLEEIDSIADRIIEITSKNK